MIDDEKQSIQECTHEGCDQKGEFKAPLSPKLLHQYQWFCLKHIQEFNKSWDFYQGWSQKEIEIDTKEKYTWRRPSWKINQEKTSPFDETFIRKKLENFYSSDFFLENFGTYTKHDSESIPFNLLNKDEKAAFEFFKLAPTKNFKQIQKTFKQLAKKYHPDHNQGSKKAEATFKKINQNYVVLKKILAKL